jgi:hypothetical protein
MTKNIEENKLLNVRERDLNERVIGIASFSLSSIHAQNLIYFHGLSAASPLLLFFLLVPVFLLLLARPYLPLLLGFPPVLIPPLFWLAPIFTRTLLFEVFEELLVCGIEVFR